MAPAYKILCVEDSVNVQQMLSFILKKAGYEPLVAYNGLEAIEKTKTLKPDLILMDIMMPDLTGIRAIQLIRDEPDNRDVPILVLSAYNDPNLIEQATKAGATLYLEKTIVPEELVRVIGEYLPMKV